MAIRLLSSENIDGNATFTGSVGIGAAPANKLHIQQAKSGSSAENYDLLRFNLTGTGAIGDSSSIVWYSTSGTKTAGIQGISGQDNILYGEIAFNVRKYTTDSFDEVMRINNRGSVGIGGAPASDSVLTVRGADTNNKYIRTINNNGTAYFGTIADGTGVIESNTSLKFTTGSSFTERMRIDSSGNVGIGTSSPSTVLDVRNSINIGGAGQDSNIYFQQNTSNQARINYYTDNSMIFDNWNGGYYFRTTSSFTPRVTILNGGNVGIGTTSPSEILQTNKNSAGNIVGGYFTNSQANTGAESVSLAFGLNRSGGDFVRQVKAITFGAEQQWTGTPSTVDGYLAFSTVSNETVSERMRITSGGQIVFQKTDNTTLPAGSINHASNDFLYVTGGTGGASFGDDNHNTRMIVFNDDYVRFDTAGTDRMRIDSSGNLLVTKQVANNATVGNQFMTDGSANSTVNGDTVARFNRLTSDGEIIRLQKDTSTVGSIGSTTSYLSGSLGIGVSSPNAKLEVNGDISIRGGNGLYFGQSTGNLNSWTTRLFSSGSTQYFNAQTFIFNNSGYGSTEFVRFTSGGRVGVGVTNPSARLQVNYDGNNGGGDLTGYGILHQSSASGQATIGAHNTGDGYANLNLSSVVGGVPKLWHISKRPNSNSNRLEYFFYDNTFYSRFIFTYLGDFHADGDIVAYSTTASDEKLKDNIEPIHNALDKVSKLNGVSFTWNCGSRKNEKDLGVLAQNVEKVLPELVREKESPYHDDQTIKTVDYEKLTAVLIEAVKDLQQKVEKLENKKCCCK